MSALVTRAAIDQAGQRYLTPLAQTGETAKLMESWIDVGVSKGESLQQVLEDDEVIARGYEFNRTCHSGDQSWEEGRHQKRSCGNNENVEKKRSWLVQDAADPSGAVRTLPTHRSRAYVTNAPAEALSFASAVQQYRDEYIGERGFGRFKGKLLQIAPMFVKRDDQVIGLTRLLSLGVGILAFIESVVRRSLRESGTKVAGLYQDSARKETDTPTSERILRAFSRITLTKIHFIYHVTPLNHVQQRLLELLGFPPDLYASLGRTVPKTVYRAA
jgi:transposase